MTRTEPSRRLWALVICLSSCGGRVSDDAPDSRARAPEAGPVDPGPAGSPLRDCKLGARPADNPGVSCHWMFEFRCYETKSEACACACPPKGDSTCVSGFPVENGMVAVSCR